MPVLSSFTGFGLLEFSSEPSEAEKIYGSLIAGYRDPQTGSATIDTTLGTHQEAKLYGWAIALGAARVALRRAGNELRGETSYELLLSHEKKFKLTPTASMSVADRRAAVDAAQRAARGPRYEAIVSALQAILGESLIAYRPITIDEAVTYPVDPTDGPGTFGRPERPANTVRLLESVARVGLPMSIGYENWNLNADEVRLTRGDVLCVDAGNWGLAEKVAILSSSGAGAERKLVAAFARPHSVGAFATSAPMPLWLSTKRHVLIVATAAAAANPDLRAQIDQLMRRMMRGPTTWDIVQPTTEGASTCGPFTLGTSPLGAVPLEAGAFTPIFYGAPAAGAPLAIASATRASFSWTAFDAIGAPTGAGTLAGIAVATATASGTISAQASSDASAAATASATGDLAASGALAGTATATGSATGVPSGGFEMSSVAWTGWWDGDHYDATGGTASGIASAGASGTSRDLTIGSNKPTKGNTVNSHDGIIFNGTNNKLTNTGLSVLSLAAAGAHTSFVVINAAVMAGTPSNPGYTMSAALTDTAGDFCVAALDSTPAAGAYIFTTGSANRDARAAMSTGSVYIVESWHDGTNLKTSVNGGATTTTACANLNAGAGSTKMGGTYNDAHFFQGTIYELAITNTTLSSGDRTSVRNALATKYGITL